MCSLLPKKKLNSTCSNNSQVGRNKEEDHQEEEAEIISSHLYLKPAHARGTLDKAVVLRRIRHRKRVNKVKSAVQAFLGSSDIGNNTTCDHPHIIRWADDAFSAP